MTCPGLQLNENTLSGVQLTFGVLFIAPPHQRNCHNYFTIEKQHIIPVYLISKRFELSSGSLSLNGHEARAHRDTSSRNTPNLVSLYLPVCVTGNHQQPLDLGAISAHLRRCSRASQHLLLPQTCSSTAFPPSSPLTSFDIKGAATSLAVYPP